MVCDNIGSTFNINGFTFRFIIQCVWNTIQYERNVVDLCFCGICYGDEYKQALNELVITINAKDVPLKKVVTKCIYYKEVGYQRKGLNSKFYEDFDNGKIEDLVWTLAELERYKKDYCDTDEDKQCFQENIINKFVEGKCVVEFSW